MCVNFFSAFLLRVWKYLRLRHTNTIKKRKKKFSAREEKKIFFFAKKKKQVATYVHIKKKRKNRVVWQFPLWNKVKITSIADGKTAKPFSWLLHTNTCEITPKLWSCALPQGFLIAEMKKCHLYWWFSTQTHGKRFDTNTGGIFYFIFCCFHSTLASIRVHGEEKACQLFLILLLIHNHLGSLFFRLDVKSI